MRYRKLSATGDYSFGHQQGDFFRDQPEAVAQAIKTRLALQTGEWWLDKTEGTPWMDSILGAHTQSTRDPVIQQRILRTPGVLSIDTYNSYLDAQRVFNVAAVVTTIYGTASIQQVI